MVHQAVRSAALDAQGDRERPRGAHGPAPCARCAADYFKSMQAKAQNQPADPLARLTVWYDGGCPLCIREIALMRRLAPAGVVRFINVLDAPGACPLSPDAMLARFHAQDSDGRMYSGAAAFAALWRVTPALRPLGLAARNPRVLAFLEGAYTAFLRLRPFLQRGIRAMLGPAR